MKKAIEGLKFGITIEYRMPDGRKCRGDLVEGSICILDLLYADDLVLICENEDDLNKVVQCFEDMTQKWGLTISVKKTKKLITKVDDQAVYADGLLEIRGEKVERVPVFTYLGSEISESGSCTLEIEKRIRLGHFKFQQLSKAVYNQPNISVKAGKL